VIRRPISLPPGPGWISSSATEFARLGPTRWNESHAIDLRRSTEEIQPAAIALEVGVPVDPVHQAVVAAGLEATDPSDTPWYRRQFTLRLSEGHALTISGPVKPSFG
jgi:hypothetical protein